MARHERSRRRRDDVLAGDRDLPWWILATSLGLSGLAFTAQRMADPAWVERVYARRIFPPVRALLSRVAGFLPVSLAELAVLGLGLCLLVLFGRNLRDVLSGSRSAQNLLARGATVGLALVALGYVLFVAAWGLNHRRPALAQLLDLPLRQADARELEQLLLELAEEACVARAELEEDTAGVAQPSSSRRELWPRLNAAWDAAAREADVLRGSAPLVRVALASPLLSALHITGIYSPFTGESHVNGAPLEITLPFVAAHEIAHARGFAREDEANYLAARVCRRAPDADLRYSAALACLDYVKLALMRADLGLAQERMAELDEGLLRDLRAIRAFWQRDRGPVVRLTGEISALANDTYLRSSGDARGVQSYGAMVDLLLAERRSR